MPDWITPNGGDDERNREMQRVRDTRGVHAQHSCAAEKVIQIAGGLQKELVGEENKNGYYRDPIVQADGDEKASKPSGVKVRPPRGAVRRQPASYFSST
jgi:hypothetical protein